MRFHAFQATAPVGTNVPALLVALVSFMAITWPGLAQRAEQPVIIGGSGQPKVEVDLGAIDETRAPPRASGLLIPETGRESGEKIILRPPGKTSAQTKAAPAPRAGAETPRLRSPRQARAAAGPLKPPPAPPRPAIAAKSAPEARPVPETAPPQPLISEKAPPPPPLAPPPMAAPPPPPPIAAAPRPAPPVPAPEQPSKPAPPPPMESAAPPPPPTAAPPVQAAVTPAPKGWGAGSTLRIAFDGGSAKLPDGARADLDALAQTFAKNSRLRLQVKAYAVGTKETASRARRLSLSRALSVRSYLIGQGIRSTRIDVRALGNKAEGGPPDRVDLLVVSR